MKACVSLAVALVMAVTGCRPDNSGSDGTAADCVSQVRLAGVVYTSHGHTDRDATKHVSADDADCHDTGPDAVGPVFPDQPRQVTTWTFHGYPPEQVLGVRVDKRTFAVFVADSIADENRERIYRVLSEPAR